MKEKKKVDVSSWAVDLMGETDHVIILILYFKIDFAASLAILMIHDQR